MELLSQGDRELMFAFSVLASLVHGFEEGSGDLLAYFSKIAGFDPPPSWASPFAVGVALPTTLAWFATLGYLHESQFALALLLSARVTDSLLSHWLLLFFRRPNPGIYSTALYIVEAAILASLLTPDVRWDGIVFGFLPFLITNPLLLRLFRD